MTQKIVYILAICLVFIVRLQAQQETEILPVKTNPGFINIFSYGVDLPAGDLADKYGLNLRFGASTSYYFANSNISIGISGDYLLGQKVKNDPVSNLRTSDGYVVSTGGLQNSLKMSQRGLVFGAYLSKIFPLKPDKIRTGIRLDIGCYYLGHWTHFNDEFGVVPQLVGEYKKGYDKMSGGFALKEFIGYQYLDQKSRISFIAGFEFFQAQTKNLRYHNYDTATNDISKNFDMLFGVKAGWILPIYIEKNPQEIYY
jgi:hypothetical protein